MDTNQETHSSQEVKKAALKKPTREFKPKTATVAPEVAPVPEPVVEEIKITGDVFVPTAAPFYPQ